MTEAPPQYTGGWTADPDVEPPTLPQGPSWSPSPSVAVPPKPGGWFALLEKVAPHSGAGVLTTLLSPRYGARAFLNGSGALTTDLVIRKPQTVPLTSSGQLVGGLFERKALTAFFTGSGQYDALSINDGLVAIIQVGYAAKFSGGGSLVVDTEGGAHYQDGLTAGVIPRYLFPAYFSSVGELLAFSGEVSVAMAYLVGSGALTVTNQKQIYPLMAVLAGNGTLSGPAFAAYQTLVNLLGTGTLNAQAFAGYLTSVGFAGAGAFTALLLASYDRASPSGGVGTVTALVSQRYTLLAAPSGNGSLTSTVWRIFSLPANLDGTGSLTSVVNRKDQLPVDFSGDGELSAEVQELLLGPFAVFPFTEGAGTTTAASVGSWTLTATDPDTAWQGEAAKGEFTGVVGSGMAINWSVVFDLLVNVAPSGPTILEVQEPGIQTTALGLDGPGMHLGFFTPDAGWQYAATSISVGVRYRIACTNAADGTTVIYVDGDEVATFTGLDNSRNFSNPSGIHDPTGFGVRVSTALGGDGTLSAMVMPAAARTAPQNGRGTLSATVQVVAANLSDTFDRADSTSGLGTASGGGTWTSRSGTMGINSNAAYGVSGTAIVTHNTPLSSDDMSVGFTLGSVSGTPANERIYLYLGLNSSAIDGVYVQYLPPSGGLAIIGPTTSITGGSTLYNLSINPLSVGDRMALIRVGNQYQIVRNETEILLEWTDASNVVPRNAAHRTSGIGTTNTGGGYRRIDDWWAEADAELVPFTPYIEENLSRSNYTVPWGCTGVWVTLVGCGGGGGSGRRNVAGTNRGGGGGGGGGGFIPRTFIPVASLGVTYSVTVNPNNGGAGGAAPTADATANNGSGGTFARFASASVSVSASAGGFATAGNTSPTVGTAGGNGGTVTGATGYPGTRGGDGQTQVAGSAAIDGTAYPSGAAGGGGASGQGTGNASSVGGKGGDTNGKTGGAGGTSSALPGTGAPLDAAVGGSGGGGAGSYAGFLDGANGVGYGAGGGGGGGGTVAGKGGNGGPGYALIEWV